MIRQPRAHFHFFGAFFHDDYGFVGLRLDGLDERGNILGGGAGVLGQLAHLIGDHGKSAASITGARRFNGGVERQQIGLLGDVVDDVDDFRDFQRAVAQ